MRAQKPASRWRTRVLLAAALVATGGVAAATIPAAAADDCSDVDVVVARGTGEPGRLGLIVGDPVFSALERQLSGLTLSSHAVDYPASLLPGSAAEGNRALVDHVSSQAQACPDQRFVLVGYSQGANVVGNSLGVSSAGVAVGSSVVSTIPDAVQPRVAAVLLFGYPLGKVGRGVNEGQFVERTLDICADGDVVCDPLGLSILAHLSYRDNAGEAAQFAAGRL